MNTYKVTIEHEPRESRFDANYYMRVTYNSERLCGGYFYFENKARKKAIKAILRHQKDLGNGVHFGLVLQATGDAKKVIGVLRNEQENLSS